MLDDVLTKFASKEAGDYYFDCAVQLRVGADGSLTKREVFETPECDLEQVECSVDGETMAYAKFAGEDLNVSLCLLKVAGEWKIIAEMQSAGVGKFNVKDFAGVCEGANEYMSCNRVSDAEGMAKIFTEVSRLTFSMGNDLAVFSQKEFCGMVTNRWNTEKHAPYAKFKDDERVLAKDSILSIAFVGASAAVLKLTVGFPPVVYTDLLFFAKFPEDGKWRIVAKSSVNEPFLIVE